MSENKIIIRNETKEDYRKVENLTREAFWNVYRPGCMEHYVLHCYRDDPAFVPELDFVMELNGELIGQVIYVRSEIDCDDGRKLPIMTFGPIGIAPEYKRQGYGKRLLDYSMEKAKEAGVARDYGQYSVLRKIRICTGKDERRALCGRPRGGLFSHQRVDSRLS